MESNTYNAQEAMRRRAEKEFNKEQMMENHKKMESLKKKRTALLFFEIAYVFIYVILILTSLVTLRFFEVLEYLLFAAPVVVTSFLGTVNKNKPLLLRKLIVPCIAIGLVSFLIYKALMMALLISAVLLFIYYHLALEEVILSEQPGYPYFVEGIEERSHYKEYIPVHDFEKCREKSGGMDNLDFQNMTNNDWVRKESGSESAEMEGISL